MSIAGCTRLIVSSLCLAVLGAELGRRVFRHKTVDEKFKAKYFGLLIAEYLVLGILLVAGAPALLGWVGVQ